MSINEKDPGGGTVEVRRTGGYTVIQDWVFDRTDLDKYEKLTYMALCRFANKAGHCWPSYDTIAKKASISRTYVAKALKSLEAKGLVVREKRSNTNGRTSNGYTIIDNPEGLVQPLNEPQDNPCTNHSTTLVQEGLSSEGLSKKDGDSIKSNELFEKMHETALLYADFPPPLGSEDRKKAVELAKKYKAHILIGAWDEYQKKKPGKPFMFFLQDMDMKEFAKKKKPTVKKDIICPDCKRVVPMLFSDTGHCQDCEDKALHEADPSFEPFDFQGMVRSLADNKTVQKCAVGY